jgi:hypothetical protein
LKTLNISVLVLSKILESSPEQFASCSTILRLTVLHSLPLRQKNASLSKYVYVIVSGICNFQFRRKERKFLKICKMARIHILPWKRRPFSSTINILPNKETQQHSIPAKCLRPLKHRVRIPLEAWISVFFIFLFRPI